MIQQQAHARIVVKDDWVFLKNGNKVRCKIIKLEYGVLYIDSDGFGKINIKWIDVEKVITKRHKEYNLKMERYF